MTAPRQVNCVDNCMSKPSKLMELQLSGQAVSVFEGRKGLVSIKFGRFHGIEVFISLIHDVSRIMFSVYLPETQHRVESRRYMNLQRFDVDEQ